MKADLLPWGLGSAALHVVLVVLLGMGDLARPVDGNLRPAGPTPIPVGPEAVVPLDTPPDFIQPQVPEQPFLPPPMIEMDFPREFEIEDTCYSSCRCRCRACYRLLDQYPPQLEPKFRKIEALTVAPTGGQPCEGAVFAALRWLAWHQSPDGMWTVAGTCDSKRCLLGAVHEDFAVGATALALLAFVRAGYGPEYQGSHDGVSFGEVVRAAIRALRERQGPDGCIGSPYGPKPMYNHVLATLALAEADSIACLERSAVRRAVDFILAAQNPGKAWRYTPKGGDNDTSVTSWTVLALLSAERGGLPPAAVAGAIAWFDEVTEGSYGLAGYTSRRYRWGTPGPNEQFEWHATTTALASAARWPLQGTKCPPCVTSSLNLLLRDKPRWDTVFIDFIYWHAGTLAFKAVDGGRGSRWDAWKEAVRQALVPHQHLRRGDCRDGSWDPVDRWSTEGGRVYATAINALTLELLADETRKD